MIAFHCKGVVCVVCGVWCVVCGRAFFVLAKGASNHPIFFVRLGSSCTRTQEMLV